ncbi:MAG: hypothetical protein HC808_03645 [Candidatus Competibacteraceae bacterium]|nr:hypothetical protein [Candidatus Competibacteraceae bacterium]
MHKQTRSGRSADDGKNLPACRGVLKRKMVAAAVIAVIGYQTPIIPGKRGRDAGVVEMNAEVVLLEAQGIGTKIFSVHAVKTDALTTLNNLIVRYHIIGVSDGGD